MHHPSVSWHIILLKFSSWNIYAFDKNIPSMNIFSDFKCPNESFNIPHVIFETTWSGFVQILHHFSVLWKINPLYFFSSNLIQLEQKKPIEVNLYGFECLSENSPNSSCLFWNQESVFLQTLHHYSVSWNITLLYIFI